MPMQHHPSRVKDFTSWWRSLITGLRRSVGVRSWASLPANFRKAATKENVYYSIKVGLAAVLAYAMALAAGVEHSLWAPMSAIIVMQVHMAASLEISLMRLLGTTVGAVLGLLAVLVLPSEAWGQMLALLAVGTICAFMELWEQRFRMAGITAVLIIFMGGQVESEALHFAGIRILEMGMGILSSLLVSMLLWPVSLSSQLNAALCKQFRQAAGALEQMTEAFVDGQRTVSSRLLDKLFADIANNGPAFEKIRNYELFHSHRDYPHLFPCVRAVDELRTYLAGMMDALNSDAGEPVRLDFRREVTRLARTTARGLKWIAAHAAGEYPPGDKPAPMQPALEAGAVRFSALRSKGFFREYDHPKVMQVFSFYNSLCHVAQAVALLQLRMEREEGAHAETPAPPSTPSA